MLSAFCTSDHCLPDHQSDLVSFSPDELTEVPDGRVEDERFDIFSAEEPHLHRTSNCHNDVSHLIVPIDHCLFPIGWGQPKTLKQKKCMLTNSTRDEVSPVCRCTNSGRHPNARHSCKIYSLVENHPKMHFEPTRQSKMFRSSDLHLAQSWSKMHWSAWR